MVRLLLLVLAIHWRELTPNYRHGACSSPRGLRSKKMLGKVISGVVGAQEFCYALSVPNDSDLPRLGPLEMHLLRAIWRRRDTTVRELIESGEFDYAYTTLMTTLDRLYKKGLLERTSE